MSKAQPVKVLAYSFIIMMISSNYMIDGTHLNRFLKTKTSNFERNNSIKYKIKENEVFINNSKDKKKKKINVFS